MHNKTKIIKNTKKGNKNFSNERENLRTMGEYSVNIIHHNGIGEWSFKENK